MKVKYLLIALLTAFAGAAYAGLTQPAVVEVDLVGGFAQGDQVTARTAKEDNVFIGCGIRIFDNGVPFTFGFCQAEDSDGDHIICVTQEPGLLEAMRSTSAYAFITFSWDENDECTRIGFSTQSFYLPNFTTKGQN